VHIVALPLLVAWIAAVVSPGPDFLAVLRTGARDSRRAGFLVGVGVVSGIACWATLAMLGLSVVIDRYEHVYTAVRAVGSLVLIGYGVLTLRSAWRRRTDRKPIDTADAPAAAAPASGRARSAGSAWRHWRLGVMTNLANPKALVFFGALFSSLLPSGTGPAGRAGLLAVMLATALAWFSMVAAVGASGPVNSLYRRAERAIDTITGGLFVGLGATLAPR
jgi:threonine efflux protein